MHPTQDALRRWSIERRCFTLTVHHTGHEGTRARGASGQLGAVDVAVLVSEPEIEWRKVKYAGRPAKGFFTIDVVPGTEGALAREQTPLAGAAHTELAVLAAAAGSVELAPFQDRIREALTKAGEDGLAGGALYKAVGGNKKAYHQALAELAETVQVLPQKQGASRRYWLTEHAPDEVRDLYIDVTTGELRSVPEPVPGTE